MVTRHMKKALIAFITIIVSHNALADRQMSKSEYQNMFMASFTYMNVIRACNISNLFSMADATVNKVIQYGYKYNLHDNDTLRISQNVSYYTAQGIESFRKTAKISCNDGEKYMRQISAVANQLN